MTVQFTCFDTAMGRCAIAWTTQGVRALSLPDRNELATINHLLARETRAQKGVPSALAQSAIAAVRAHLAGRPAKLSSVPLDLRGTTAFARRVYTALREVPAGSTVSYGELAHAAGSDKAARAVGGAMARNPIPVFIPCHRVLSQGGGRGGFSAPGGLETKAKLLSLEGVELRS